MTNIEITTYDHETFSGYLASPENVSESNKAPCVIIIQEIFGVNEGIRKKCNWLAKHGFIACAPDLFHRFGAGIELSDNKEEELQKAFKYFEKFDIEQGLDDIQETLLTLKHHKYSTGNVGALGYCLGGKLAYLASTLSNIKASIGYYGVGIENMLANAMHINVPLMLHIAEEDGFVPPEAQHKIHNALNEHPQVTLHSYQGADHAFTREGGDNYNKAMAKLADERSITFLKNNLC